MPTLANGIMSKLKRKNMIQESPRRKRNARRKTKAAKEKMIKETNTFYPDRKKETNGNIKLHNID